MNLTRNERKRNERVWGAMVSLAAMLTVAGCSAAGGETVEAGSVLTDSAEDDFAPSVVVTTTILGSVVGDIATCAVGDDSSVTVVMVQCLDSKMTAVVVCTSQMSYDEHIHVFVSHCLCVVHRDKQRDFCLIAAIFCSADSSRISLLCLTPRFYLKVLPTTSGL